jgi:hypothetical protein
LAKEKPPMIRAMWFYGGISLLLIPLEALSIALHLRDGVNLVTLLIIFALSLLIAMAICKDIWNLRVRLFPLWADIAMAVAAFGSFAALIAIREAGVLVWNLSYLSVPMLVVSISIAAVSAATESKKHVRVYFGARTFSFRPNEPHSNQG